MFQNKDWWLFRLKWRFAILKPAQVSRRGVLWQEGGPVGSSTGSTWSPDRPAQPSRHGCPCCTPAWPGGPSTCTGRSCGCVSGTWELQGTARCRPRSWNPSPAGPSPPAAGRQRKAAGYHDNRLKQEGAEVNWGVKNTSNSPNVH